MYVRYDTRADEKRRREKRKKAMLSFYG